jgi:hypothetical protein
MNTAIDSKRDDVFLQPLVDGIDFLPDSSGIYCIVNRVNGRRYVGQATKSIRKRCVMHRHELRGCRTSNELLRRDVAVHGADAFFFFAPRIDGIGITGMSLRLDPLEIWFAVQLGATDESHGYVLEAGHHPTRSTRFRDRERKLMRRNSSKYELLAGVDLFDPIKPAILDSWVPGS